MLQNPGLESGSGNTPTCWALAGYGTNTFTWTWTTDAHSGLRAENLSITSYTNGDRKMLNAFNGTCSIATAAGRRYTITVWYKSTARPVIFAFTSTTGPTGAYNYLAQSPQQSPTSTWQQATWTTPAMPAGHDQPLDRDGPQRSRGRRLDGRLRGIPDGVADRQ